MIPSELTHPVPLSMSHALSAGTAEGEAGGMAPSPVLWEPLGSSLNFGGIAVAGRSRAFSLFPSGRPAVLAAGPGADAVDDAAPADAVGAGAVAEGFALSGPQAARPRTAVALQAIRVARRSS